MSKLLSCWRGKALALMVAFHLGWQLFSPAQSGAAPCAAMRLSPENPPPKLDERTFGELFDTCKPCAEKEAWTEVAWIGEFWQGRQRAARVGKPLFIFAMNGHPLGCV